LREEGLREEGFEVGDVDYYVFGQGVQAAVWKGSHLTLILQLMLCLFQF